jgi:hypothetical protein
MFSDTGISSNTRSKYDNEYFCGLHSYLYGWKHAIEKLGIISLPPTANIWPLLSNS